MTSVGFLSNENQVSYHRLKNAIDVCRLQYTQSVMDTDMYVKDTNMRQKVASLYFGFCKPLIKNPGKVDYIRLPRLG